MNLFKMLNSAELNEEEFDGLKRFVIFKMTSDGFKGKPILSKSDMRDYILTNIEIEINKWMDK